MPAFTDQLGGNEPVGQRRACDGAQRGRITIRTGTQDEAVWLEVADTGSGIPPDTLNHIFEPFFTTKPVGKGTGLGFSLSYGIVQKHHGRIEVKSVVAQVTTFRVTLPMHRPVNIGLSAACQRHATAASSPVRFSS